MSKTYQYSNQQTQMYRQKQQQEKALIEYYVYEDIQNLINLLYSRKAIHEYFQNDPNNPIVILSNNKVILQLNLSSGIHKDWHYQYQIIMNYLINYKMKKPLHQKLLNMWLKNL
ncbi:unnamed protein product [Paramecium primaurelia]|uniref:Uncharacterized protein n=1 Tax=Paramecium primaurelia TaxID=5886 RepID=A0A8S1QVW2_PARPR|nr:unnamed protein product [Paramecium primaurelia]